MLIIIATWDLHTAYYNCYIGVSILAYYIDYIEPSIPAHILAYYSQYRGSPHQPIIVAI
jgi:hypothetical protein